MTTPRRLTDIYREAASETPPAALDAAVLAAAAGAAAKRSLPSRPWHRRWLAPAGLAFSLLLGIGLALQLRQAEEIGEPKGGAGIASAPPVLREQVAAAVPPSSKAESAVPAPAAPLRAEADTARHDRAASDSPRPLTAPPPAAEGKQQREEVFAAPAASGIAADRGAPALRAAAVPSAPAQQKSAERDARTFRDSAADWLAEVRRQLAAGQREAAGTELKAFVKIHGLDAVPEDLKGLLTP